MKGIAFPIGFKYLFRGRKYGEVELYFSQEPMCVEEVDLLEPGEGYSKNIQYMIKRGVQGDFDCLLPLEAIEVGNYDAPSGMRFPIGVSNNNPTTATMLDRVELFPCKSNNLSTMLKLLNDPPFYLSHSEGGFRLHINVGGKYAEIPCQSYSPRCWSGFAHPSITKVGASGNKSLSKFSDLDWEEVASLL